MATGASSDITLEIKVGQLIMAGIAGTTVADDARYLIEELRIGNVILMGRNVESPHQVLTLTSDLQRCAIEALGFPLLIGTDQEGGMVRRLTERTGFMPMPSAVTVGTCRRPEAIRRYARAVGEELRAVGIHVTFAPVLDVGDNPNNPVIGRLNRAFGPTPRQVVRAAIPFLQGLHDAGVLAGGKHFPGHGSTSKDSHFSLPTVTKARGDLDVTELPPFQQAIDAGIDMLLTAHVTYPALDPADDPATISAPILGGLLRQELGFSGLIVTDGLEMDGIRRQMPLGEAAVRAVEAGVDVVLCVRQHPERGDVIDEIRDGLIEAARSGRLSATRIDESYQRVVDVKRRHGVGPATGEGIDKVGGPEHLRMVAEMNVKSVGPGNPGLVRSLIWRLRRLLQSACGPLD